MVATLRARERTARRGGKMICANKRAPKLILVQFLEAKFFCQKGVQGFDELRALPLSRAAAPPR
jgi:hypothetical protein